MGDGFSIIDGQFYVGYGSEQRLATQEEIINAYNNMKRLKHEYGEEAERYKRVIEDICTKTSRVIYGDN